MLENGSPIQSVDGELKTALPQTTTALKKAVAVADEPAIGRLGIGVPLRQSDGDPACIHVLPLMTGTPGLAWRPARPRPCSSTRRVGSGRATEAHGIRSYAGRSPRHGRAACRQVRERDC